MNVIELNFKIIEPFTIKMLIRLLIVSYILLMSQNQIHAEILWANEIDNFSSQYTDSKNSNQFSIFQILGEPNTIEGGPDDPCSWRPSERNSKNGEWVILKFAKSINACQIIINQATNLGCISIIRLYDSIGVEYEVFKDTTRLIESNGGLFKHNFAKTKTPINKVFIKINSLATIGWDMIDAVGISDETTNYEVPINISEISQFQGKPENLGLKVNTIYNDVAPVISADGKALYFTRGNDPRNFGGSQDQDIWLSEIDSSGEFSESINIGAPLNDKWGNSVFSITPDGQSILLMNSYIPNQPPGPGVSISYNSIDGWSFPIPLKFEVPLDFSKYVDVSLSNSGRTIILAIEDTSSFGGRDLYVSFLEKDSIWSEPLNLGKDINTASDEMGVYLASDDRTIYFSTKGMPGYGDYDVFKSKRLDESWQKWSKPINLGSAINTSGFDAYFTLPASGEYVYFTSAINSIGNLDIFRLKLSTELKPSPVVLIEGYVLNDETDQPIHTEIIYEDLETGQEVGKARTDPITGRYSIVLPAGRLYGFRAIEKSSYPISANLDLRELDIYKEIKTDLKLTPLKKESIIRLNNIFFDSGSFDLRQESESELNRLTELFKEYKKLSIEIQGHTDNVGSSESNQALSLKRAKSVYKYLINKGIESERLTYRGFGETKPKANNNTAEGRQENRRVDFRIIEL